MSLILDALNRSQQERNNDNNAPGIETQHWVEPLPNNNRWRRSIPWVCLLLALCAIAWLLLGADREAASNADKPNAVNSAPVASNKVEPVVLAVPRTVERTAPVAIAKAAVGPKVDSTAVNNLYKTEKKEKVVPAVVSVPEPPAPEIETREQEIDIEEMISRARMEVANAQLAEHSAPFLSELSQQLKDQVPTIYYTQHDVAREPSRSSVVLNGNTVQAGTSLAGGLKLEEILSQSIVLSYRGTQFRLKALNSWINL